MIMGKRNICYLITGKGVNNKKKSEFIFVHLNGKINTFLIVYEGCSETIETFTLFSLKKKIVNPLKIPPKVHQDKMYKCKSFLVHSII